RSGTVLSLRVKAGPVYSIRRCADSRHCGTPAWSPIASELGQSAADARPRRGALGPPQASARRPTATAFDAVETSVTTLHVRADAIQSAVPCAVLARRSALL